MTEYDCRGTWAMGNCASMMACPSYVGGSPDDYGPNYNGPAGDDVMNCTQTQASVGGVAALQREGMTCWDNPNDQQTARSLHVGGVNVCLCDGSARWISDFVQTLPSVYPGNYSVWDRLIASGDGQTISARHILTIAANGQVLFRPAKVASDRPRPRNQ